MRLLAAIIKREFTGYFITPIAYVFIAVFVFLQATAELERLRLLVLTGRLDDAISLGEAWPHTRSPLLPAVRATLGRAFAYRLHRLHVELHATLLRVNGHIAAANDLVAYLGTERET